jgi:hypothetical protein
MIYMYLYNIKQANELISVLIITDTRLHKCNNITVQVDNTKQLKFMGFWYLMNTISR